MLIGFAIGIGVLVMAMRSANKAEERRAVAMGTIGRTALGSERDIAEVTWQDERTRTFHTVRFRFLSPGDWHEGDLFGISYDPDNPAGPVFAAADYEVYVDDGRDPPWVGSFLAVTACTLCVSGWLLRGWFNLRAKSAPVSEWHARLYVGTYRGNVGNIELLLTPVDSALVPPDERWQRVIWSPALGELSDGQTVRARVRRGFFGRAVVEATDGSLIWPAGRLRKSPVSYPVSWPSSWSFTRPRVGWLLCIFLLIVPFLAGITIQQGKFVPWVVGPEFAAFPICFYAFFFHVWGWMGGVLARVPKTERSI